MSMIHAIFEGGVFRPIHPVDLPERSEVEFEPRLVDCPLAESIAAKDSIKAAIYEILSRSYDTDEPANILETHNDHQP